MTDLPPLTITPAIVVKAETRDFPAFQRAVDAGSTAVLAVGVNPQPGDYTADKLKNSDGTSVSPGRWSCRKVDGKYVWSPAINPAAVFTPTPPVYQYQPLVPSLGVFRPASGST